MVIAPSRQEDNSESKGQGVTTSYRLDRLTRRLGETTVAVCTCTPVLRTQRRAGRVGYVDYAADSGSPAEDAVPSKTSQLVPFSSCLDYWLHGFPLQRVHQLSQSGAFHSLQQITLAK